MKEIISLNEPSLSIRCAARGEEVAGRCFAMTVESLGDSRVFAFASHEEMTRCARLLEAARAVRPSAASRARDVSELDAHVWYHGSTAGKRRWKYHRLVLLGASVTHYRSDDDVKEAFGVSAGDSVTLREQGENGKPNELTIVSGGDTRTFAFTSLEDAKLWNAALMKAIRGEDSSSSTIDKRMHQNSILASRFAKPESTSISGSSSSSEADSAVHRMIMHSMNQQTELVIARANANKRSSIAVVSDSDAPPVSGPAEPAASAAAPGASGEP